jgi:L-ascorbate metabolism protein UlaG (beta-lactamase superfamily)
MRLTYFGHSCFLVEAGGARIVIDPYLSQNPHGKVDPGTVPCDYVLCTHAHEDHILDAPALARTFGATIVAPYELATYFSTFGFKVLDLMPGGGVNLPWGRVQMTAAIHSSSVELPEGKFITGGIASGFLLQAEGKTLYHAGDTALFGDMALIGRKRLDVALLPIGDFYTMGPDDALEALHLLRPKLAIPMHYNSSEQTRTDPQAFVAAAIRAGHLARVMTPRETIEL